jgi:hypothetical protein
MKDVCITSVLARTLICLSVSGPFCAQVVASDDVVSRLDNKQLRQETEFFFRHYTVVAS